MESISPTGKYELSLSYSGEVHFGPPFFSVAAKGFSLDPTLSPITEEICWSANENYLCLVVIRSINQELVSELNVIPVSTGVGSVIESRRGQITINSVDNSGQVEYEVMIDGNRVVKKN